MAKYCDDAVQDAFLDYLKTNSDRLFVCSTQPTTYTEASATYMLASQTIDSADFTGPAAGAVSGRKITINQQADISITNTGTAQHVALAKSGTTALLYVTTCTSQALTSGNTVTCPAWAIEVRDPS